MGSDFTLAPAGGGVGLLDPSGSALGRTRDPAVLVPGDPEAVSRTIDGLATVGDAVDRTADGLHRIDTGNIWHGPASDAFREHFGGKPRLWATLAEALSGTAGALVPYRDTLRWAQSEAAAAILEFDQGEQASRAARREYEASLEVHRQAATVGVVAPPPVFDDHGEPLRIAARQRLERARDQLAERAAETAGRVGTHCNTLPEQPGFVRRLVLDGIDHGRFQLIQVADVVAGAWAAVTDMATLGAAVNPTSFYNLTHPQQYGENLHTLAQGAQHAVTHPVELAKSVTQWDTWTDSPGRATGTLLPDLLASLLCGGAGAASRVGTTAGRLGRAVTAATPAPRHADVPGSAERTEVLPAQPPGDQAGPGFGPQGSQTLVPEPKPDGGVAADRAADQPPFEELYPDHDDPYNPPELEPLLPRVAEPPAAGPDVDPRWDVEEPVPSVDLGIDPDVPPPPAPDPAAADYLDNPLYQAGPEVHAEYLDRFGPITGEQQLRLAEWRYEHFDQISHLDDSELIALDRHQRHHLEINQALSDHDVHALRDLDPQIRETVSALNKLPTYDGVVYRGIDVDPGELAAILDAYRTGSVVRIPGFATADLALPDPGNVQFIVESVHGARVPQLSDAMFPSQEVMWPPGSLFQVRDVTTDPVSDTITIRLSDLPRT